MENFDYIKAFSRNLGWITPEEQKLLSEKRVAIAGVGGVGGQYAETLARIGISKFHLAEFDTYELPNFNRQNGSGMSTIGHKKLDIIEGIIKDINPNAQITRFDNGVNASNIKEFLTHVDIYLDGLDYFAIQERILVFNTAEKLGIPAITAAPAGMSAALLSFGPKSMSFEKYFGMKSDLPEVENAVRFVVGLTPTFIQMKYLVQKNYSNALEKKLPSIAPGIYLCAGVASACVIKVLLNRGPIRWAPWSLQFDAYLQTYKCRYIWFGYRNPLQRIKLWISKKYLKLN